NHPVAVFCGHFGIFTYPANLAKNMRRNLLSYGFFSEFPKERIGKTPGPSRKDKMKPQRVRISWFTLITIFIYTYFHEFRIRVFVLKIRSQKDILEHEKTFLCNLFKYVG